MTREPASTAERLAAEGVPARMIDVDNPATGESIATVEELSDDRVRELVDLARAAQAGWEALGFKQRAGLMRALRAWLVRERERLLDCIVAENGKTREDALLGDILYVADSLGFWAKKGPRYLADVTPRTHSPFLLGRKVIVRQRPLGVVGVIAPWNYPLILGIGDALPALMAGNAVVIKPSEVAPLAVRMVVDGAQEVGVPEGVLQVATGRGATGAALVEHADMIQFTGSTVTGRLVAARCGERLIPCSLELGGKDAMIVLADANLDRAANMAVEFGLRNAGQVCVSVERVYVESPAYDAFVAKVVEKAKTLRTGPPGPYGSVDIGAITFAPQLETIERHVADALDKGARTVLGGRRGDGPGRFYEPTILVHVNHTMACMTEETFGPTLPIMKVRDADEAVRLANDSSYGLGSSIFTRDIAKAHRLTRRLLAGNTWINDVFLTYLAQEAPFAGARSSGLGARHGQQGIRKYCRPHTILVTRFGLKHEPTMLPNSHSRSRMLERLLVLLWGRRPK